MDDSDTKNLLWELPRIKMNQIHPEEVVTNFAHSEGGPESEVPEVNEIEEIKRSEQALQLIEGEAWKMKENEDRYEVDYYIVLYQQQLSVYEGDSQNGKLLHQYPFPHGAEYRFSNNIMYIYDENGQEIRLIIPEGQLFNDIWMKWLSSTNLFTDLKREKADEILPNCNDFSLNDKKIDGEPQIKNAVEFEHFYRPNRLMNSQQQKYDKKIEKHMINRDRKFIQWAPSRDWSRLFVLSTIPKWDDQHVAMYLEFYDFNNEKQTILPSPLRINFLSQLLRPQCIEFVANIMKFEASEFMIEASFTADTIAIRMKNSNFRIIYLKPDWTVKEIKMFQINDASIESLTLLCPKLLYVKSNGFYYMQSVTYFSDDKYPANGDVHEIVLEEDFSKNTTLKNIIQCGIYDILIYDEHVQILSNINPLNKLDDILVDHNILQLLKSQKIIKLDHHSIACFPSSLNDESIRINIIKISLDNLVIGHCCDIISLKSPWNTQASDCLINLIKFQDGKYAVLIVKSLSNNEQFYQYYMYKNDRYEFAYQKALSDCINFQQIPHLPLVNINGSLFINCDHYFNNYQLELDLRLEDTEINNQDQENINSQEVVVYHPNFIEYFCRFIEQKEDIIDKYTQSEKNIHQVEIPEFKTSIIMKQGGENSGIFIFQPSFEKIKHLKIKKPIRYQKHKVIYRDAQYKVCIILSTDDALYEMQMCFHQFAEVTLSPLKFIMNFTEAQKEYEIYIDDNFTISLFIAASDFYFKHFSFNLQGKKEETIQIDFEDQMSQISIQQLSQFIQRIAQSQSISFGKLFQKNFKSIIFKNTEALIKKKSKACVFAFQNKIILFEKEVNSLIIMDDQFTVIGTVILNSKFPLSIIRIASSMDSGALEYINQQNSKFPIPILGSLQDYQSYNKLLHNYGKNFNYPIPFQFGLNDGFIAHLDLQSEKLIFFNSKQDKKDGNIAARIEVIARSESFIDVIINSKERKEIEDRMNKIEISHLLSYNVNKGMNLITGTKNHPEKDVIYSVLYKLLEIAEIKELPMLIYNTSVDPNKYESILDVLIENKAIKLAQLIVTIALKQDQIGYIYSRLYDYLSIFSANELQMFFDNQIFFFKIPEDCYQEYQIVKKTLVSPFSDYQTFYEIKKNMANVESQILKIEEVKARTKKMDYRHPVEEENDEEQEKVEHSEYLEEEEKQEEEDEDEEDSQFKEDKDRVEEMKDSDHQEQGKQQDQVDINEKYQEEKVVRVPTEYYAINLMNLIQSRKKSLNQNHRQVTQMLNKIVEIDESIIEKESFQIIIDFKWDSYAWKFFSLQLVLFICFITALILDVLAVSKNSHIFSTDDTNQGIPRLISAAIMILFAIYEVANFVVTRKTYFKSFWNVNDLLLIFVYVTYFTMTFAKPDQQDVLKSLQLLIVIFSFIKFCFLIRIWTQVSFLVRMLIVVFKELLIFLTFFLLVIGGLTVMAQIIIRKSGDEYRGINEAAYFVIVLRQAIGDYATSSFIEGTQDLKIMAWLLWFLILIIGNIVFMNFIIAVVSESYESCMEKKVLLIYKAKLEMITECEDLLPQWFFTKKNWFPRFIIIRREQGSSAGGEKSDEWYGFVKQMKRHLEYETTKLKEIINRSSDQTKKEMKTGQDEAKKVTAEMKTGHEEVKKEIAELKTGQEVVKKDIGELKTGQEEVKVHINEIKLILSAVFKDQIAKMKAEEVQPNQNKENDDNDDNDNKEQSDEIEDY